MDAADSRWGILRLYLLQVLINFITVTKLRTFPKRDRSKLAVTNCMRAKFLLKTKNFLKIKILSIREFQKFHQEKHPDKYLKKNLKKRRSSHNLHLQRIRSTVLRATLIKARQFKQDMQWWIRITLGVSSRKICKSKKMKMKNEMNLKLRTWKRLNRRNLTRILVMMRLNI